MTTLSETEEPRNMPLTRVVGIETLESLFTESLILAQDERWRCA